jgi:predicted RND superfamily exporter protein
VSARAAAFFRFLLRHRRVALAIEVALLVAAAVSARRTEVRFQYRDFYSYAGNPQLPKYEEYHQVFGDPAGNVVVLVHAPDVFAPEVLKLVQEVTAALEPERLFVRVRSLTNARSIRATADSVASGPIVERPPATAAERAALRDAVLADPLLRRRLVSEDGRATAVLAELRTPAELASVAEQREAIAVVRRTLASVHAPPGVTLDVTGAPVVEVDTTQSLLGDQLVLMPGVILVLVVALLLTFRSWHGVALPLASVMVAVGWTAGLFPLFGRPVDIIGSIIPTTLLVYGVVDPIFVLTRYQRKRAAGFERDEAIVAASSELALPCLLTSVTTAVGFGAFVTAKLPTILYYGLTVGIGVLLVWVSTVTVLPVLLAVLPEGRRVARPQIMGQVSRTVVAIWRRVHEHRGAVLAATLLFLAVGGWHARVQHISNEYVGSLPRGRSYDTVRALERELTGVVRTVVFLEGPPGSMRQPAVLRAMASVEEFLHEQPLVTSTSSLADVVAQANQAFHDGDRKAHVVPASAALIAQYLTLLDPVDRADFVTIDDSKASITALSTDAGSEPMRSLRAALGAKVDQAFAGLGVRATLTGNAIVAWTAMDDIILDVLYGFAFAFAAAAFIVWIPFRSVRTAVGIIVPNLVPVTFCFLLFRIGHLKLRLDNAIVLCVAIGGLFNTTIHFIAQLRLRVARGEGTPDEIIERALEEVAAPAMFTAAILSAGFAVLLLSSFPGLQALGFLSMVTLAVGFCSDMLITPIIMRQLYGFRALSRAANPQRPQGELA